MQKQTNQQLITVDPKDFMFGAISGICGVSVSHPIDTIKANVQARKPVKYDLRSLYSGIKPPLIGVGIEKALVFGIYENTSRYLRQNYAMNYQQIIGLSGAIAGLGASFIVTPYERFKIIQQTNRNATVLNIVRSQPTHLFRGLSATFSRETPGFAIYFLTYENLKRQYCSTYNRDISAGATLAFGGTAGALAWALIYPQDTVKTRMQADMTGKNNSYVTIIRDIYREGGKNFTGNLRHIYGLSAFFKGFHFALLRAVPLHAGTFGMMELLKKINS